MVKKAVKEKAMRIKIGILGIVLFSCILMSSHAYGQINESDINLQELFIEANLQKVIGNKENAAELFQRVLEEDGTNHAAAYELARLQMEADKADEAVKSIKVAVEKEPNNIWYQKLLADIYQKLEQHEEAADVFEKLVKKEPKNELFYYKWAYFLVKANKINQAVKVYDKLEDQVGINEEIIRRKHSLYLGIGENKKAATELERLIKAFPNNINYQLLLAEFYGQIGQSKEARSVYERVLELDPSNVKAKLALVSDRSSGNDEMRYLLSLKPVFEDPEASIDLKITKLVPLVEKVVNTNNLALADETLKLTTILESVHPNQAKARAISGDLLYHSERPLKALEKYKQTLELDETVYMVWEQILYIYQEQKDFDNLLKTSENALDLFPNRGIFQYMHGMALAKLGKSEDALDVLELASVMTGDNPHLALEVQFQLGKVYHDLKQYNSSDDAFSKALKMNPNDPNVLKTYCDLLADRGENLNQAKEIAEQLNDLFPKVPAYQNTYGRVLYKMGAFKESKSWLERALGNGGEGDPLILEHFGDVLFQLGEQENAVQYWLKAVEHGNKSELLEKKIADRQLYE